MMKCVCAFSRRADVRREDCQAYYEGQHAPLAARHFPFAGYVRNHLIDAPDIGFDTISEFWADDLERLTAPLGGPVGEIMAQDEARFMDRARTNPAQSEEFVLGRDRSNGGRCLRWAALLDWPKAFDGRARQAILAWATPIATEAGAISLDLLRMESGPAFPARAILWLSDAKGLPPPPAGVALTAIRVRRFVTPKSALGRWRL